jgi:CheY-like chemotaxis protein
LLNNAIKFSSAGGLVRINCEGNGKEAIVNIEDSGQGITPEFLPFVFERFRQADGSKTRMYGGLGLGLALVKSFVEAHHGTVEVQSEGPGEGTRVVVRLPRFEVESEAGVELRGIEAKPQTGPAHLLVVEDDDDTLEILRATFTAHGFDVTSCDSAAAALETAPQISADLIISDIGMPKMDGFELMRRLRKMPELRNTPAIALTGYAAQNDAEMALSAGFNAHVSKPVDPAELLALVDQLLKGVERS